MQFSISKINQQAIYLQPIPNMQRSKLLVQDRSYGDLTLKELKRAHYQSHHKGLGGEMRLLSQLDHKKYTKYEALREVRNRRWRPQLPHQIGNSLKPIHGFYISRTEARLSKKGEIRNELQDCKKADYEVSDSEDMF